MTKNSQLKTNLRNKTEKSAKELWACSLGIQKTAQFGAQEHQK